jgi:P27 family predicted phage terminase small subunit
MGRGRPPKPTEQHLREGTFRKDRHNLPVVLGGREIDAVPPDRLSETQAEIWTYLFNDLTEAGILDKTDLVTFEGLVLIVDHLRLAQADIEENGLLIDEDKYNKDGDLVGSVRKRNPAHQIAKESLSLLRQYAEQFGLSPSARARLGLARVTGMTAAEQLRDKLGENPMDEPPIEGEAKEIK